MVKVNPFSLLTNLRKWPFLHALSFFGNTWGKSDFDFKLKRKEEKKERKKKYERAACKNDEIDKMIIFFIVKLRDLM